jgi:hypothetical protein
LAGRIWHELATIMVMAPGGLDRIRDKTCCRRRAGLTRLALAVDVI